jgi:hypothetical protein
MADAPRDHEVELRIIMDALAESVAEASSGEVLEEARQDGDDPQVTAQRVRAILTRR